MFQRRVGAYACGYGTERAGTVTCGRFLTAAPPPKPKTIDIPKRSLEDGDFFKQKKSLVGQ